MKLLKQLVVVAVIALAGSQAVAAADWNTPLTLVLGVATAVLLLLAYAWIVRRTEHRAPVEVARKGAAGALGRGLLIGFAMFGAVIANIAFLGDYRVLGRGSVAGAVALFGFTAAAVVTEEIIFRGILFRIVEGRLGTWLSLVLTSLLFGLEHAFNPGANAWSVLIIAIEAGGMLTAACISAGTSPRERSSAPTSPARAPRRACCTVRFPVRPRSAAAGSGPRAASTRWSRGCC
jgi:membrane protease YdiL (CAAX protease family)